jgi:hypothetical protein
VQVTTDIPVPPGAKCWLVDWKFFSEEFPEYVGTDFNDAFLIEVGSSNIGISGTTITAPNNVAYDSHGSLITINTTGSLGMSVANAVGSTYDGATAKLTTQASIPSGATNLRLIFTVLDLGDSNYDSTVFIDNIRFSGSACGDPVTTPTSNSPPSVIVGASSVTVDEGLVASVSGSYSDSNTSDDVTLTASVGSITKTGTHSGAWTWSLETSDGPVQSQTVTITADDGKGGGGSVTFSLNVLNVAPTAMLANTGPFPEGGTGVISFSGQSDSSSTDAAAGFTYSFACDGTNFGPFSSSASTTCAFPDNGSHIVAGHIRDKDGGVSTYQTTVVVQNLAPVPSIVAPDTAAEGESITVTGSATDPGSVDTGAGIALSWVIKKNGGLYASGTGATVSFTPDDDGTYDVVLTATDKDGDLGHATRSIAVYNVAPTPSITAPMSGPEGEVVSVTGSATDPGAADVAAGLSLSWSITKNGAAYASGSGANLTFVPDDNATYNVVLMATDKDGGSTQVMRSIAIYNVAPTLSIAAPESGFEGDVLSVTGFATDPGAADVAAGLVLSWSVTKDGAAYASGSGASLSFAPDDDATYVVVLTATDKDGGSAQVTRSIAVYNVAPTPSSSAPESGLEGTAIHVLGFATDPGAADVAAGLVLSWSVTKDGVAYASGSGASLTFVPDDNATYVVVLTATDKDGGSTQTFRSIAVYNVAPTPSVIAPESGLEGTAISVFGSATDPGAADVATGLALSWSVTKDGAAFASGSGDSFTFLPDDNATYVVLLTATDKDNGTSTKSASIVIANVAPTALLANNGSILEGTSVLVSFSGAFDPAVVDTEAGPRYVFACNGGSLAGATYATSTSTASTLCSFADNGTYIVRARILDKNDGFTEYTSTVVVNNVAPTITDVTGPSGPLALGTAAVLHTTFTDPGVLDTHTCTYSWDDGTAETQVLATSSSGSGSCTTSHAYASAGVYSVKVTVTDKDGGIASTLYLYVVVYDPGAGFVTGGGWIISPAGSSPLNPSATGRANFGFVSKYLKGASTPTGQTEFQFKAGSLNFHSLSYDWLVVAGARAQYKGTGTLNGSGEYGFLLSMVDGHLLGNHEADRFRIKIWNKATGAIVYDNNLGAADDIDASNPQVIDGGNIVIHK